MPNQITFSCIAFRCLVRVVSTGTSSRLSRILIEVFFCHSSSFVCFSDIFTTIYHATDISWNIFIFSHATGYTGSDLCVTVEAPWVAILWSPCTSHVSVRAYSVPEFLDYTRQLHTSSLASSFHVPIGFCTQEVALCSCTPDIFISVCSDWFHRKRN